MLVSLIFLLVNIYLICQPAQKKVSLKNLYLRLHIDENRTKIEPVLFQIQKAKDLHLTPVLSQTYWYPTFWNSFFSFLKNFLSFLDENSRLFSIIFPIHKFFQFFIPYFLFFLAVRY